MDAWLFWKALSTGLAVAAPVGPMSLLCIHRTLDHGRGAGLVFGAGIAAADMTYAALAGLGVTAISSLLLAGSFWIRLAGSLLLLVLGLRIALAVPVVDNRADVTQSAGRSFLVAYGLTLANPPTIIFFAGIFAALASVAVVSHAVTFAVGVFAGSMLWWLLLTVVVSRSAKVFRPPVMLWINRVSGVVLVSFAVYGLTKLS
jgi:threonine/homoserine/homoserine lactone efflux protein